MSEKEGGTLVKQKGKSYRMPRWLRMLWRSKTGLLGFVIVSIAVACALFAPWLAPYDPNAINPLNMLKPPAFMAGGDPAFLLGTDNLGHDILSRLIYGARVSMIIGVLSVILAGVIGTAFGLLAGYYGGILDSVIMRVTDAFHSIPRMLLAMVAVTLMRAGIGTLVLVIGITG